MIFFLEMKMISLKKFHERVRQYFLFNCNASIPTKISFVDECVKKLKLPNTENYELTRQC
jgi:hypothetical protein